MHKANYDSRNGLNDLSAKEWLQLTRSWWSQQGLGHAHPHAKIESQHPAPFSYQDVEKLIRFFTKEGMTVLDPFCGVASTLKAAALSGRNAIGIEVSSKWAQLGKQRLECEVPRRIRGRVHLRIIRGDCLGILSRLPPQSVDYIVTSPPYWNILTKDPDHKTRARRLSRGLPTRYSKSPRDLGNLASYPLFIRKLQRALRLSCRVLKKGRYLTIIVSDFRHRADFRAFHMDVASAGEAAGLSLKGILILIQNSKQLYPYGYPFALVQNIHHQYALIFQRPQ